MKFILSTVFAVAVGLVGCEPHQSDQRQTQPITCVNNLKEIGLAFRVWSGDRGDQFCFNTSTNAGGTLEFCAAGPDGFDKNACLHFQAMSNELNVPFILVCPQDRSKSAATNWPGLRAENVTYRLRTGTNLDAASPHEILVVCPVDGNILYCDGHVEEPKK